MQRSSREMQSAFPVKRFQFQSTFENITLKQFHYEELQ